MTRFVALLRGINVGGKNLIPMAGLRACFEEGGFRDVVTYIQSGNVVFSSEGRRRTLVPRIEEILASAFGYRARIVLRSGVQMKRIVAGAPVGFGSEPTRFRYDVLFLREPLTARTALRSVIAKPGVDEVHAGPGVLYFSRLTQRAGQSFLVRLPSQEVYQEMTVRNWNTTTAVREMM
jgi:uncharacterized protein (DUF1697 family)